MNDKTCKHCNNYDRDTGACEGEAAEYINIQVDGKPIKVHFHAHGWYAPPPDFGCTYWTPRPCLKEYGKCDCAKCRAKEDAELDRDEDSGVLK